MSEVDARPAVPAKMGDFVELRCGVIVGPLCENDDKVYPLGLGVINDIGRICTWCADGRTYVDKDRDQADIVAVVPRQASVTQQPVERSGGLQMRVGGLYRLRNGEVATCVNLYQHASDGEDLYRVEWRGGAYAANVLVDGRANRDRELQTDVIAEVTDDATSEPQRVEPDDVNHPKHYTSHPSGVECITITEHFSFCVGNAIKYLWRAGLKTDDPITDLEKAAWYVAREIQRLKGGA